MNDFAFLFSALLGLLTYKSGALDREGAISAAIIGYIIWETQGVSWVFLLFIFFALSTIATKIGRGFRKKSHKKRGFENVLANGLVATAMAVSGNFGGFFGAISAVFADTVSSEIGMLSDELPRMVTDLKFTIPGTDGAVTPLGFISALIAAMTLGFTAFVMRFGGPEVMFVSLICGFFGTVVDSIFGATLQRQGTLGNHEVNFLAALFGAILGSLLI